MLNYLVVQKTVPFLNGHSKNIFTVVWLCRLENNGLLGQLNGDRT